MGMMAPDWLHEAANQERWRDAEWGRWEQLRGRLDELGIQTVTPTEDGRALSASGREVVDLREDLAHEDAQPFLEALHRLAERAESHIRRHRL